MKQYLSPETQVLQIYNTFAICEVSGGGEPKSAGTSIRNMPRQTLTVQWI
ncbi:MAG: hypothetical protein MJZ64_05645 [Paludibacteraceae bacterium]|nr:hypothetical protein [Paludibacteraceae bacterium]